jgi:2-C-methyl-D-erythritol 2,4-cyclodiphosphate synthase
MASLRVGHGYDAHRLEPGRALILGGVSIPADRGLAGHSDADVLVHAVIDALLGAAAMGDIGKLFPDSDPELAGIASLRMLENVAQRLGREGFTPVNIDATLIAQRPKIAPHVDAMRRNIASACGMELGRISVKATTEEGMGFTGAEAGMAAHAVCLVEQRGR